MIVEHPDPDAFERIDRHAQHIARVASWVASRADTEATPSERPATSMRGDAAAVLATSDGATQAQPPTEPAGHMAVMAHDLATEANALADAARTRDIAAVTAAAGRVSASCANCHAEHRWRGGEE
jgi:cytochrome c556